MINYKVFVSVGGKCGGRGEGGVGGPSEEEKMSPRGTILAGKVKPKD